MWGRWALQRHEWEEAAQAYSYGLQAVEQLFRTQLLRSGRETWLREAQKLPLEAAYAHARRGDFESAVMALEVGRTRLLADVLERERADLEHLPRLGQAELYSRYNSAASRVWVLENSELRQENVPPGFDPTSELRASRAELEAAIGAIRQVPGYEDFFLRPSFKRIQQALTARFTIDGRPGVGVYLAATLAGGLALLVHEGGVQSVFLDFDEGDLHALLVGREGDPAGGGYLAGQLDDVKLRHSLNEVLPIVGEKIIRPISDALRGLHESGGAGAEALILIPTGLLSLLPLHAAPFMTECESRSLLDAFTPHFTPSARALAHSRESLAVLASGPPRLFGVGNPLPLTPNFKSLTFACIEVEEIARLIGDNAEVSCELQATREAVEKGLADAKYLHFSCHGYFEPEGPLASGRSWAAQTG